MLSISACAPPSGFILRAIPSLLYLCVLCSSAVRLSIITLGL